MPGRCGPGDAPHGRLTGRAQGAGDPLPWTVTSGHPRNAPPGPRRRTFLGLGGAGVVGALGLTGCSSAPTSSAQQTSPSAAASPSSSAPSAAASSASPVVETGIKDLAVGEDAVVRTSMTTAWHRADEGRSWTDEPVTEADARPGQWLSRMDGVQQRWLVGRTERLRPPDQLGTARPRRA